MARLNEPPQPVGESVDALKRRFIRQNREIARANSTQSLRIRTLEAENSRLLSENITLREENINLKNDLTEGHSKLALENVTAVKSQLEEKVAELGVLLISLGQAQHSRVEKPSTDQRAKRRSSSSSLLRRSASARTWGSALDFSEPVLEGRLPPIHEDKTYPRKTLDLDEIRATLPDITNLTDSPELGPPPVAHFENSDPIKQDVDVPATLQRSPSKDSNAEDADKGVSERILLSHLETRRKRKEGITSKDMSQDDIDGTQCAELATKPPDTVVTQPLKVGAKRKLSVRDDEDRSMVSKNPDKDAFAYSRRSKEQGSGAKDVGNLKAKQDPSGVFRLGSDGKRASNPSSTSRRALSEKSVNTDPVNSPTKTKPANTEKPSEPKKSPSRKHRDQESQKERPATMKAVKHLDFGILPKVTTFERVEIPPATPAPPDLDLFSPTSSNPSAARAESRDTPPPSDLGSEAAAAGARPSRRQRSAVSYAEPNLRDKMRRPTKELVDAVTDVKLIRSTSGKTDSSRSDEEATGRDKSKPIAIKKESESNDDSVWKTKEIAAKEPASPLDNKSSSALPSTVIVTDRRRRSAALRPGTTDADASAAYPSSSSSSNTTIAALLAGSSSNSHKRHSRVRESSEALAADAVPALKESASVFDFHSSSPPRSQDGKSSTSNKPARISRRYTSVPENLGRTASSSGHKRTTSGEDSDKDKEKKALAAAALICNAAAAAAGGTSGKEKAKESRAATATTSTDTHGKEGLVESVTASVAARAARRRETVANSASVNNIAASTNSDADSKDLGTKRELRGLGEIGDTNNNNNNNNQGSLRGRAERAERRRSMMV